MQYRDIPGTGGVYSNGYLLTWDNPAYLQMTLYGRNAEVVYSVTEHKDGIYHHGWAVDSDGVAAGVYLTRSGPEGRIDMLDPRGNLTLTINTGSYVPQRVAFAPDHTLWTVGYAGADRSGEDFNVLHHYERNGKELSEALPWSQIKSENNSATTVDALVGGMWLHIAKDRLGFECRPHYGYHTWIEVSLSGTLLDQYDLRDSEGNGYSPVAMTTSGNVYAQRWRDGVLHGWAVLDRSARTWRKLTDLPTGRIIGSDGDDVAFANNDGSIKTVTLVPSNSLLTTTKEQRAALTTKR